MFSVVPKPLLTNILRIIRTLYQQYQWLTKCLRKSMANYRLHNIRWMYGSASYCPSHRVANVLANMNIWISRWIRPKWRLDSDYFHLGLTPRSSSVGPLLTNILRIYYECLPTLANAFTNVANAYARFTNVTNAYENHAEWPSSQHSLKFTNRFVNWAIFVRRWGIICERSEFVTNAYEDTANVAKFERLSNISFR